jgi:hypothetical protein
MAHTFLRSRSRLGTGKKHDVAEGALPQRCDLMPGVGKNPRHR